MNVRADDLALLLGIDNARQAIEKEIRRIREDERQLQPLEPFANLRRFVLPQDAVVDEDTREAIANSPVNEQGCHRRVDAAAQAADHSPASDLAADP